MGASMVKKVIIGGIAFIVVGLALAFGPSLLSGFEATRNDTESFVQTNDDLTVTTNSTVVTLTRPLIAADIGYITTVTSNASETPTVASVTTTTATIASLDAEGGAGTRTLTTTYLYGTNQYYTGLGTTVQMGPTLVLLGFIIMVGVVAFMGIRVKAK